MDGYWPTRRPCPKTAATTPLPHLQVSPRIFAAHAGTRTNHGTFQPCAGTSVASVSSFIAGASQINKLLRPAAFVQRTGKATSAGLRSVRLRGKRSRLWCRRLDSNQRPGISAGNAACSIRLSYVCIEGGYSSFRAARSFPCLAFASRSQAQLQHRGLRGLLQDFASPIRLSRYTLVTRGVHVELEVSVGIGPTTCSLRMSCSAS